jgi:arsenate reductase
MKITVYEKPTCTTCRNLATLFRENGIDYEKVNYFIDPIGEGKLRELLRKSKLEPADVLRKNEPVAKELGLSSATDPDKLIKAIVENPSLLQRPIVEIGDKAVLARPAEKVLDLLSESGIK